MPSVAAWKLAYRGRRLVSISGRESDPEAMVGVTLRQQAVELLFTSAHAGAAIRSNNRC